MAPSEGAKLRLRDVAAQWPFAGAFHFRAQYSPPAEPYVFLDMPDANMPLPVAPDGAVVLRALPLDFLGGVPRGGAPGEAWAWGEGELAAFRASRGGGSSSSSSGGGGSGAEGGASPAWGSGGGGGGGDSPGAAVAEAGGSGGGGEGAWSDLDGGFQEGGPSIGAGRGGGTLAEAAEEGLAQAAAAAVAARDAAGEAAGAALSAAKKMFSGWGAAMKGVLGKGAASSGAGAGEQ
jgi:hypothetical protein